MKIQVTKKLQFGNERIFPVDEVSKFIAEFGKRGTFRPDEIQMLESLGFEIEYVPDTLPSMDKGRERG